jgi:hypothetical protein
LNADDAIDFELTDEAIARHPRESATRVIAAVGSQRSGHQLKVTPDV